MTRKRVALYLLHRFTVTFHACKSWTSRCCLHLPLVSLIQFMLTCTNDPSNAAKRQVGDYNTFQPKCEVGHGVTVASGCCIGEISQLLLSGFRSHFSFPSVFRLSSRRCAFFSRSSAVETAAGQSRDSWPEGAKKGGGGACLARDAGQLLFI